MALVPQDLTIAAPHDDEVQLVSGRAPAGFHSLTQFLSLRFCESMLQ